MLWWCAQGLVSCSEPFRRLVTQGMVLGKTVKVTACQSGRFYATSVRWCASCCFAARRACCCVSLAPVRVFPCHEYVYEFAALCAYQDADSGKYLFGEEASRALVAGSGVVRWEKMSKSKGNGVEPSHIIKESGVDATRLNVLFKVAVAGSRGRGVAGSRGRGVAGSLVFALQLKLSFTYSCPCDGPCTKPGTPQHGAGVGRGYSCGPNKVDQAPGRSCRVGGGQWLRRQLCWQR